MKLQDQVYKVVNSRLKRICAAEYKAAKGKRKTPPKTVTYSSLVTDLVGYLNELNHCSSERAEEIYSLATTGEANHAFEKAI